MVEGIDVFQRYEGPINWTEVEQAGVSFAFIKVTNGTSPASPPADVYVQGCRATGITPGGYHYALGGDPLVQAHAFATELLRLGLADRARGQLPPALDFEDPSLPTDGSQRRGWILAFMGYLGKLVPTAYEQMLYSSANELDQIETSKLVVPGVNVLPWDAEWGPNDGQNHGIVHYQGGGGPAAVHQYTSRGHVPGIGGLVDRDSASTNIVEPTSTPTPPGPTPAPVIPAGTYLRIGSTGPYVTALQARLNRDYPLYSHLAVDGIFGPLTRGVVEEFQRRAHLQVDGIAGPITLHALGLQ